MTVGRADEVKHIRRKCEWKATPPHENSITAARQKSKGAERVNGALQRAKTHGGRQRAQSVQDAMEKGVKLQKYNGTN